MGCGASSPANAPTPGGANKKHQGTPGARLKSEEHQRLEEALEAVSRAEDRLRVALEYGDVREWQGAVVQARIRALCGSPCTFARDSCFRGPTYIFTHLNRHYFLTFILHLFRLPG